MYLSGTVLGDTITETDPTKLVRELHATAMAIGQAKARNDVDMKVKRFAAPRRARGGDIVPVSGLCDNRRC